MDQNRDQNQNGKKKFRSYRDLIVWQKSMKLAARVYEVTRGMPREEQFGLTADMRARAVAVPASIAEGYGRRSVEEYRRCLEAAVGSLFALETQLALCTELGALNTDLEELNQEIGAIARMIKSLASKLNGRNSERGAGEPVAAGAANYSN
jgi:four helix bundle protein